MSEPQKKRMPVRRAKMKWLATRGIWRRFTGARRLEKSFETS
jgi:hypothetical protein